MMNTKDYTVSACLFIPTRKDLPISACIISSASRLCQAEGLRAVVVDVGVVSNTLT